MITKEILLFLRIQIPCIRYFAKHQKNISNEYIFTIEKLYCEYCPSNYIEKLLYLDGINKVHTDFNNTNIENIKVHIQYDKKTKLVKKKLIKIEKALINKKGYILI